MSRIYFYFQVIKSDQLLSSKKMSNYEIILLKIKPITNLMTHQYRKIKLSYARTTKEEK